MSWQGIKDFGKDMIRTWQSLPPYSFLPPLVEEENEWPLPERPALGLEAEAARREHGKALASYMNRMLANNIAQLNRNWAAIGRGSSGMLPRAQRQAAGDIAWAGANVAGQGSLALMNQLMQAQIAREGMDEERMWRQAQLNQQGEPDYTGLGQLLAYAMTV